MSRLFVSTRQDHRRLNQPWHERLPQTHGERRRIHGPIQLMARERDPADAIVFIAGAVAIVAALLTIIFPGLAWLLPLLKGAS